MNFSEDLIAVEIQPAVLPHDNDSFGKNTGA